MRIFTALSPAFVVALAATAAAQKPMFNVSGRGYATGYQAVPSGYYPEAMSFADFDGDGDLDVVTANSGPFVQTQVSVVPNLGKGVYGAPAFYDIPDLGAGVATGDFDGDGDADFAVTLSGVMSGVSGVKIFLNDGAGGFVAGSTLVYGSGSAGIVAEDFNGDGKLDLATADFGYYGSNNTVSLKLGGGDGTFGDGGTFAVGQAPRGLRAADVTGDGKLDLVVACTDAFSVLPNGGTGFGAATTYDVPTYTTGALGQCVAVGDIDGDGDADVCTGGYYTSVEGGENGAAVFKNTGTGSFGAPTVFPFREFTVSGANAIELSDLTGDGKLDILSAHLGQWSVMAGDGTGSFGASDNYLSADTPSDVRAIDLDGDGDRDPVVLNRGSFELSVYRNPGTGVFPMPSYYPVASTTRATASGDLDGDGDQDLVVGGDDRKISVLTNDGAGGFVSRDVLAGIDGVSKLRLADLNRDFRPDLIWLSSNSISDTKFYTALNNGAGFDAPQAWDLAAGTRDSLEAADVDGDGDADVIASAGDVAYVFRNDESAGFGAVWSAPVPSYFPTGGSITVADLNRDGKPDLAFGTRTFLGAGDGTFTEGVDVGFDGRKVRAGDLNGDGNVDLVGVGEDTVSVALGNGDGTFAAATAYFGPSSKPLWDVALGDYDHDGDLDVAVAVSNGNSVAVYENPGNGRLLPESRYRLNGDARDLIAADLNGDGGTDLAAISSSRLLPGGVAILMSANGFDPGSETGPLSLQSFRGNLQKVPLRVEFRLPGTTTPVETHIAFRSETGDISVPSVRAGTYDVAVVGGTFLRNSLRNVAIGGNRRFTTTLTLLNGDANGDNVVDLADLNLVSRAFRATSASPNWNPRADLNGDGIVDLADYNIVSRNFRKTGLR